MAAIDRATSASAHAPMLVTALENVILPIIHAYAPGVAANSSTADKNEYPAAEGGYYLEPEAQQLVSALEKFISGMLVRSQVVQHSSSAENKLGDKILGNTLATVPTHVGQENVIQTSSRNQVDSEKHPMLKLALEQVRYRVFNKMPIRLLAFKADGSDMELIERSTIFDRISLAMESDFYQADISWKLRLLTVDDYDTASRENQDVIDEFISHYAEYAILSHTWLHDAPGEVIYAAWKAGKFDRGSAGYQKLANFCKIAAMDHKITFGWMDTICINKDSSAELDESIRSMYAWYANASVCITYLAETTALSHMHNDVWFTRGWTLQELLAPHSIIFYGANWQELPTDMYDDGKHYVMEDEIFMATNIKPHHRQFFGTHRQQIPISERMEWAANRQVTREEDVAYSLMGIFNVSLSIAYGEGSERAFVRLLKEIMNLPGGSVYDILNWGSTRGTSNTVSSCIPSHPEQFLKRSCEHIYWPTPRIPFTLTHLGLHVSILLMPAISVSLSSPDTPWSSIGMFYARASVDLAPHINPHIPMAHSFPRLYNVLDKTSLSCANSTGWRTPDRGPSRCSIVFGFLNFNEWDVGVSFPRSTGFALCFVMDYDKLQRIRTSTPVRFDIKSNAPHSFEVQKSELWEHGIELRTMYL